MRLEGSTISSGGLNGSTCTTGGSVYNSFSVYGPGALTGVATLQASPNDGGSWFDVPDDAGTPITIAAGAMVRVHNVECTHLRVQSTLAEAAERVFQIHGTGYEAS